MTNPTTITRIFTFLAETRAEIPSNELAVTNLPAKTAQKYARSHRELDCRHQIFRENSWHNLAGHRQSTVNHDAHESHECKQRRADGIPERENEREEERQKVRRKKRKRDEETTNVERMETKTEDKIRKSKTPMVGRQRAEGNLRGVNE